MAKRTIDPATLTFGCEIECFVPLTVAAEMGPSYGRPSQVPGLPEGWRAKTDSSLSTSQRGMTGVEVVSPVLRGAEGVRQVVEVCRWLQARGATVNRTCGFHVHVGMDADRAEDVCRVVRMVARHEKALYAATGTRSRENGSFCRPIKGEEHYQAKFRDGGEVSPRSFSRYHMLNVTNILGGMRPTVEFRLFAGTTSELKAVMNIRLALGLVQRALEMARSPKWDRDAQDVREQSEGRARLGHMLAELGWVGSYTDGKAFGLVEAEGAPALADCVAEARRLATKYDGGAQD